MSVTNAPLKRPRYALQNEDEMGFSPLLVVTNAVVKIEAINYNYQTVAGKKYLFRNMFSFVKTGVTIIN